MKAIIASLAAFTAIVALAARAFSAAPAAPTFPPYWPTAVPTVPSAAPLPAAAPLIREMYANAQRLGSVHTVTTADYVDPDIERVHAQIVDDTSLRTFRSIESTTSQSTPLSPIVTASREAWESRMVGHVEADRQVAPAPPSNWHCQSIPGDLTKSYPTVETWKHITETRNLGAAMVDGQLTWHITAFGIWKQPKKHRTNYEPLDYYIAQTGHTVVRELTDARANSMEGELIPYVQVIDYSRWSEPVTVTLPKACQKSAS